MTEQIRSLTNKVHLAGVVAEIDVDKKTGLKYREGVTKTGIPYISFSGAIRCGESDIYTIPFRSFIKSKKSNGEDSKAYANAVKWIKEVVPLTESKENATYVDMVGSLTDNPFIKDNKLVEATQYNIQFFSDFKGYAADIDIEGFVNAITDEVKKVGEDEIPTGRQRMRLISRDIFSNTLDLNKIVVPQDLVAPLRDNDYEKGCTATFYITLTPTKAEAPQKAGGIGVQRTTSGREYLEWVLSGALPVIDSESELAIDPKTIKLAMVERKARLDDMEEKAKNNPNNAAPAAASTATNRQGVGAVPTKAPTTSVDDDEEFPF